MSESNLHSALTSTSDCSALLTAALVRESRILAKRRGRARNKSFYEHSEVLLT